LLFPAGLQKALINTHYLPEKVRDFVLASRWSERIHLVHEDALLGTGGTVLRNRAFFGGHSFMVAHADNLSRFDVKAFWKRHDERPAGVAITIMTFETDAPQTCGIVVEDRQGIVREFHEKRPDPPGNHANGAVYLFDPEVIDFLDALGKPVVDLSTEVLPHFLGRMWTYHNSVYHRDIGNPGSLRKAEREYPEV
jgi:mannose-1-phosphate guanylyltransferase